MRQEHDVLGVMDVPDEMYYGAQTARSLHCFAIGNDLMPLSVIRAFGRVKKAAAQVNAELGLLGHDLAKAIIEAAEELISGKLDAHFPLRVWQTGSGTQTHMNVNEVLANRANEQLGGAKGSKTPVHPNDHVNLGQSSNDLFPTVMHLAAVEQLTQMLLPALMFLSEALKKKKEEFAFILKIGRTHLMDAVPLTLGQEFSGYEAHVLHAIKEIKNTLDGLYHLAIGGTAVGTGLNAHPLFAEKVVACLRDETGFPFALCGNRFAALAGHEAIVFASGALRTFAASFFKIANDIRWMGSGPRCGLQELFLPENEPGSSIMPGKVNPTQCEAVMMVCIQVMGLDSAVSYAGAQGNFELNVFKPLIIYNFLTEIHLLTDSIHSFVKYLLEGLRPNIKQLSEEVSRSLMLITPLARVIGYDQAGQIAREAQLTGETVREIVLRKGILPVEELDNLLDPKKMVY